MQNGIKTPFEAPIKPQKKKTVTNVVKAVNEHFGCDFITTAGLNNIISRPNIVANRFKGITITRFQLDTKKYKNGLGSRYEPLQIPETIREETIV